MLMLLRMDPEKSTLRMICPHARMFMKCYPCTTDHTLHKFDDVTIIKAIVSNQPVYYRIISLRLSENLCLECVHTIYLHKVMYGC